MKIPFKAAKFSNILYLKLKPMPLVHLEEDHSIY